MLELKKEVDPIDMYDVQGELECSMRLLSILQCWFRDFLDGDKKDADRAYFVYKAEDYSALTLQIYKALDDLRERARLTDLADTEKSESSPELTSAPKQ